MTFSAAALVLVLTTLSIWHWRFVVVSDALPELKLGEPLVGWKANPHNKYEIVMLEDGKPCCGWREMIRPKNSVHPCLAGRKRGLDGVANVHF